MSLMNIFRSKNEELAELKKQLDLIKKENDIFIEEIRMLKKIMYGIDIDIK